VPNDFNGDGRSDVLAYNDNGTAADWQMNGAHIEGIYHFFRAGAGLAYCRHRRFQWRWHQRHRCPSRQRQRGRLADEQSQLAASTGFLDHHARLAHCLYRRFQRRRQERYLAYNDDGTVADWQMNGAHIEGIYHFVGLAPGWHIAGTGDFNGDGTSDIVVRHDNGSVADWQMNNHQLAASTGFWITTPTGTLRAPAISMATAGAIS